MVYTEPEVLSASFAGLAADRLYELYSFVRALKNRGILSDFNPPYFHLPPAVSTLDSFSTRLPESDVTHHDVKSVRTFRFLLHLKRRVGFERASGAPSGCREESGRTLRLHLDLVDFQPSPAGFPRRCSSQVLTARDAQEF